MMEKIRVAKTAGFCFGVKRAVETVYEQVKKDGGPVYTYGPIIHNEEVVADLEARGVHVLHGRRDLEALAEGTVVIRSHGVPEEIYRLIEERGAYLRGRHLSLCPQDSPDCGKIQQGRLADRDYR